MQFSPNRQLEKLFRRTKLWKESWQAKGRGNVMAILSLTEVLEFACD